MKNILNTIFLQEGKGGGEGWKFVTTWKLRGSHGFFSVVLYKWMIVYYVYIILMVIMKNLIFLKYFFCSN